MTFQRQLTPILEQSVIQEITGVVNSSGARCVGEKGTWMLSVTLQNWKTSSDQLEIIPLHLSQDLAENDVSAAIDRLAPFSIVRLLVRVAKDFAQNRADGLLVELLGPVKTDTELQAIAEKLQGAATLDDSTFGKFTVNREFGWFSALAKWNSRPVILSLVSDDNVDMTRPLAMAHAIWAAQSEWQERIYAASLAALLDPKNCACLQDLQVGITVEEICNSMTLESVITSSENVEFWLDNDDLLSEHSIHVWGKFPDGPLHARIEG